MDSDKLLEIKRQFVHLILGLLIAVFIFLIEPLYGKFVVIPLILAAAVLFILPYIGTELRIHNYLQFHFERPKDIEHFPYRGAILYCIGIIPAILLLNINTACAIIAVLSVGDSTSTLIGSFYGNHRIGHKSIEGLAAFIFFSFLAGLIFLQNNTIMAIIFAVIGGIIELSNVYHDHIILDDNLLVPIGLTIVALLIQPFI